MITRSIMNDNAIEVVYFYQQYCVYFVEITYLLFALLCDIHSPTISLRCVQRIFPSIESVIHVVLESLILCVNRWEWTLTINLSNDQNFEIPLCNKHLFSYREYVYSENYKLLTNYLKFHNTDRYYIAQEEIRVNILSSFLIYNTNGCVYYSTCKRFNNKI